MGGIMDISGLTRIAIFGITVSILSTALFTLFLAGGGDYSYAAISDYRDDLVEFSGDSMVNSNPWILTHVYTPWTVTDGVENHIDPDNWLYGSEISRDDYDQIGKSADIKLNVGQKSSRMLTVGNPIDYEYEDGKKWWAGGNDWGITLVPDWDVVDSLLDAVGTSRYNYTSGTANNWDYTGWRYVFDPTLPFKVNGGDDDRANASVRDGALSIVWYSFDGNEGLSGGLDIYGGDVILASYAATDIIATYNTSSGFATVYDFDFKGTHLQLSIKFDQAAIAAGQPLMEAWVNGNWSMAISSVSAGNFYDVENSNAFVNTAGNMVETFIDIYTFKTPSIDNPWVDVILWLIVGLPMTLAMLCVTTQMVSGIIRVI